VLQKLSMGMRLQTVLVLGGVSRNAQIQKIARGVDVVIATPGRLKDLIDDRKIKLNKGPPRVCNHACPISLRKVHND
jgi:ATP-dependent RNA helicase RhlE